MVVWHTGMTSASSASNTLPLISLTQSTVPSRTVNEPVEVHRPPRSNQCIRIRQCRKHTNPIIPEVLSITASGWIQVAPRRGGFQKEEIGSREMERDGLIGILKLYSPKLAVCVHICKCLPPLTSLGPDARQWKQRSEWRDKVGRGGKHLPAREQP